MLQIKASQRVGAFWEWISGRMCSVHMEGGAYARVLVRHSIT